MKMSYAEIQDRHKVLIAIGQLTLPRKITRAIGRNIVKFEAELKRMNDQLPDIAKRYENGEFITEEKLEAYKDEVRELSETEVDVNIVTFKDTELEKCENERYSILTAVQEASIEWMIDYGEEESNPAS